MIGSLLQADIEQIIRAKNWEELREAFSELDPSDIAELLMDVPAEDQGVIFRILPRQQAARVFSYLPLDRQQELVQSLSNAQVHAILNEMSPDDRTRLLEELPSQVTRRLLETLKPEQLRIARELLGYPEGTAGRYMTPEYIALPPDVTCADALHRIRTAGRDVETLNVLYIINEQGKLLEDVRLGTVVLADPQTMIGDIEERPLVSVPATATRDEVLEAFERYDRVALPVVDNDGHMLGIITADDIIDVVEQKATEEMHRLGGMEALDLPYAQTPFWQMIRKRVGWLSALFLGEMLTATAMGHFEQEIAQAVVLALFVPLIISSGGNSGSQAASLIIRALALKELRLRDWWRVFGREILSGVALGTVLGLIGFVRIAVWYAAGWQHYQGHPYLVGMTVWASLIGVVCFGTITGSMLPFLLRRLGFDPATSSAPFVATLVDVTGLCIYFLVALLILRGTLL
ncbi:magnesium transporter [Fontivita pretiosa]|uniref:magnesium transporter n=1 Tax=Fontivita pretiosa TaxID=2989684 RepID=UPI003D16B31D